MLHMQLQDWTDLRTKAAPRPTGPCHRRSLNVAWIGTHPAANARFCPAQAGTPLGLQPHALDTAPADLRQGHEVF